MVVGIDVGTLTTKTVILRENGEVRGRSHVLTGIDLQAAAAKSLADACRDADIDREDIAYVAATGYGRFRVDFRDLQITEMTCHAFGAHSLFPATRSALDVGAQNSRAMAVAADGRVKKFRVNDKCAAGAGRFMERVARALEVNLEQLGPLSLQANDPTPISSICAVLAESEVINHVTEGKKIEDIISGTHYSITDRIVALLKQVGGEEEITLTGGVAKNVGFVHALEDRIGIKMNVCPDSEYMGAIGAAHLGLRRLRKIGAAPAAT
jgi:predicted CoA-substrate-specific enzyme activase